MPQFDVVILPSFAQVEDWRKQHARASAEGLFSQTVTTFNAWIADLWELHGDGRAIADSLQRQTIMQAAFDEASAISLEEPDAPCDQEACDSLTVSRGVVKLAAQCVREAAGVPAFDWAVAQASQGAAIEGIALREAALLQVIARYYDLLAQAGLIEVGQAAAQLANRARVVFPRPVSVLLARSAPPDWRMTSFFEACGQVRLTVEEAPGAAGIGRMRDGVGLRFGFPSGRYAQPGLVMDLVRGFSEKGPRSGAALEADVVVAAKDPLSLYKHIEQSLAQEGFAGCVQAQVPFSSTDFGWRFLSLHRVLSEEDWSKEDLSDAVLPPYSGFNQAQATQVDKELRANRLALKDECLASLRSASDTFSQLEELASDPEADILLGVFEQIAFSSPGRSDAWRVEQLAAASSVRSCTSAARAVGASMGTVMRVLEDVLVTASYESAHGRARAGGEADGTAGAGRVVVTTQAVAAQMGAGSCGRLILCDLTSEDYPVADRDDAAATLFAKLGLLPVDTMLARSRRMFTALQELPASELVCLRPLNDWNGNPTYPAAMLQELTDAHRADAGLADELDELYAIPSRFVDSMVQRGEELLFANVEASPAGVGQPLAASMPSGSPGDMPADSVEKVALLRRLPGGRLLAGFSPSPSQVETYLECPYKWFAQRRLDVEELDEGFGALERGSFCHAVLQRFYQEFGERGFSKVDDSNLEDAKRLMRLIAEEEAEAQRQLEPGSGRYVAADQIEQRELEACKNQLVDYLDFEAAFLPTFRPLHLEYRIGADDGIVYAGHPFIGIVDRIDVDDEGHAVIVDYKGSVGPEYEIEGKGPCNPGKVQTRMYARAVERALGLHVVGALYVSYGKSHGCAGAFDGRVLEAAHLPNARVDHCSCAAACSPDDEPVEEFSQMTFSGMLDATEALVANAIASMEAGRVQPDPISPDACRYCPVANCPVGGA